MPDTTTTTTSDPDNAIDSLAGCGQYIDRLSRQNALDDSNREILGRTKERTAEINRRIHDQLDRCLARSSESGLKSFGHLGRETRIEIARQLMSPQEFEKFEDELRVPRSGSAGHCGSTDIVELLKKFQEQNVSTDDPKFFADFEKRARIFSALAKDKESGLSLEELTQILRAICDAISELQDIVETLEPEDRDQLKQYKIITAAKTIEAARLDIGQSNVGKNSKFMIPELARDIEVIVEQAVASRRIQTINDQRVRLKGEKQLLEAMIRSAPLKRDTTSLSARAGELDKIIDGLDVEFESAVKELQKIS